MNSGEYRTVTTGVSPFWARKYAREAGKNWEAFYKRNGTNFFRDRHWTTQERNDGFRVLSDGKSEAAAAGEEEEEEEEESDSDTEKRNEISNDNDRDDTEDKKAINCHIRPSNKSTRQEGSQRPHVHVVRRQKRLRQERVKLLEVGCGVGNSIWPLLEEHNDDKEQVYEVYAFDMSATAISLLRAHASAKDVTAFVWDITRATSEVPREISGVKFDVICCIFMLSAVPPEKHCMVMERLCSLMREDGGTLAFRDYARGDLAQGRFKTRNRIEEDWFVRQDGTLSYFFDEEYLCDLMRKCGLDAQYVRRVERRIENRKEEKEMHRVFMQGEFRKGVKRQ